MDGQLEVRRVGVDGSPHGDLLTPEPTSVWPTNEPIEEVWLHPDERMLEVVGVRGFDMMLHSLTVDESETVVGLRAQIAFTREAAGRLTEPAEQPGIPLVGLLWRAEVRLQGPLSGRPVVDRGTLHTEPPREAVSGRVRARLQAELALARTPAERRRIRQLIKAVRRNPYKAISPTGLSPPEG